MFEYFISYELFLKITFLSIHGHFAFIKLNTQSSLPLCETFAKELFCKKVFVKTLKQFIQKLQ